MNRMESRRETHFYDSSHNGVLVCVCFPVFLSTSCVCACAAFFLFILNEYLKLVFFEIDSTETKITRHYHIL